MIESEVIGGVNSTRVQSIMSKNGFSEGITRYRDMISDDRIDGSPNKRVRIDKAGTVDKDDKDHDNDKYPEEFVRGIF